jgi:hypothetical protein
LLPSSRAREGSSPVGCDTGVPGASSPDRPLDPLAVGRLRPLVLVLSTSTNYRDSTSIGPRPLPSKSFPVHCALHHLRLQTCLASQRSSSCTLRRRITIGLTHAPLCCRYGVDCDAAVPGGQTWHHVIFRHHRGVLYPTAMRSAGVGASSTVGRVAAMLAPFAPLVVSLSSSLGVEASLTPMKYNFLGNMLSVGKTALP